MERPDGVDHVGERHAGGGGGSEQQGLELRLLLRQEVFKVGQFGSIHPGEMGAGVGPDENIEFLGAAMGRAPQGAAAANGDIVNGGDVFHGRGRQSLWGEGQDGLTLRGQTGFVAQPGGRVL